MDNGRSTAYRRQPAPGRTLWERINQEASFEDWLFDKGIHTHRFTQPYDGGAAMKLLLVGIDWADQKHDVCIMNETGGVLFAFTIPHSHEGFSTLREQVWTAAPEGATVLCAVETNNGILVNFLLEQGWTVYPINPKSVDRYRERTRTAKAKSDQLDAWLLSDILRTDRHLHRPMLPDTEAVRELKELTRGREALVQESVRLVNQLQACLKAYWPESIGMFSDLACPWALDFLSEYPTLKQARAVNTEDLRAFLKKHRHPQWRSKAEGIQTSLQAPHVQVPDYVSRARSRHMVHLAKQLKTVVDDLKAYEKEIERLLKSHPDGALFLSLPGAGATLAAKLLAEVGDNRERYKNANSLQCEAGTAPVTKKSGKTLSQVLFRRACKKPLRQAFQLFAGCSIRFCPWARALYAEQRSKGKCHDEAVRIIANRWAKIVYGMRKSGTHYDDGIYTAAKERFLKRNTAA